MIKVMLVDDHRLIRAGIAKLLEQANGIKVVAQADSGEQAITLLRDNHSDVVLMDLKMPGIGGLETTRRLIRMKPDIKIMAVTGCLEGIFAARMLQAGAAGYITKDCSEDELIVAIRKVHVGQRYLSPEIAQKLALQHVTESESSAIEQLSERELQITLMIAHGKKVQEISTTLHLSTKTVNSYRYRIFAKLNIKSDVELTHCAIRAGLLDEYEKLD